MCVQKLAYTNSDADNVYLSLSVSEIVQDEMIAVLLRERKMKSETLNDKDGD